MNPAVEKIIQTLEMSPHPEGGYFKEVHRSKDQVASLRHEGALRQAGTSIYYLLDAHHYSAWHRFNSDETWHFYAGVPIDVYVIYPSGELLTYRLGHVLEHNLLSQVTVPAEHWFAAKPITDDSFTLVGCNVFPGFEFKDFQLADPEKLKQQYPAHTALIERFSA
jgi:hypothetical protein